MEGFKDMQPPRVKETLEEKEAAKKRLEKAIHSDEGYLGDVPPNDPRIEHIKKYGLYDDKKEDDN